MIETGKIIPIFSDKYGEKFGGKITSTPQKNIVETSISFFIDTEITIITMYIIFSISYSTNITFITMITFFFCINITY